MAFILIAHWYRRRWVSDWSNVVVGSSMMIIESLTHASIISTMVTELKAETEYE